MQAVKVGPIYLSRISDDVIISNEQKEILLTFYENGMISTKREMGSTIREFAAQTRLSEIQVMVCVKTSRQS